MFKLLKSWLFSVFILLGLSAPAQAELLLLKQGNDGVYYAVDSQTYPKEPQETQNEIKVIFKDILMKYQWPMVTSYFYEFPQDDQTSYLEALQGNHGITAFIQTKIDEVVPKGSYKVQFIPTTIFELAAINTHFEANISIDFDKYKFAKDIGIGLRKYEGKPNADLYAIQNACSTYNQSDEIFNYFLHTSSYLINHHKNMMLGSEICKNTNENVTSLLENIINHHYELNERRHNPEYMSPHDLDIFVKSTELECKAESENSFMLMRGTGGYNAGDQYGGNILDSPYLESAQDYAEALKGWPESLKEQILMGWPESLNKQITSWNMEEKSSIKIKNFTPSSLSLGNSLMAGTFRDSKVLMGARALDHIRLGYGYALMFPITEFFIDKAEPTLHQKYMISALHPLISLWALGELFHSRSKISVFDPHKTYLPYNGTLLSNLPAKGLLANETEKESINYDKNYHTGYLITPTVDWTTLHSSISKDIGEHSLWLKEPEYNAQGLMSPQNKFALFSSMEMAAFRNYFSKLQPVLAQIKNPPLLRSANLPRQGVPGEIKFPLSIPMTVPEQRQYEKNVFTGIAQNPANLNTKQIISTDLSISFDDLRKRTKEHALVIPKGRYVSFSHFVDFASPEEILDLMRTVANTAKKLGLEGTGYRIITNNSLNPGAGKAIGNDAHQEVPHFHIHLAGGECLGKDVVGGKTDMKVSPNPFASDWTAQQFYRYAASHKIAERMIAGATKETTRKIIAYRIDQGASIGVGQLIGFLMLDQKSQSVYTSIDDFAQHASANEMAGLFKFINDVARQVGIYKSGYRLISDFGNDAQQYPKNIMNVLIAGGGPLGITFSNMYGNITVWEVYPFVADYAQLLDYPHDHCAANSNDTYKLLKELEDNKPKKYQKKEKEAVLILHHNGNVDFLIKKLEDVEKPELVTQMYIRRSNRDNKIEKLPDIIPVKFKNLQILDISDNGIKYLPENIGDLKHLKILAASRNKIETLPESIGALSELKKLHLDENAHKYGEWQGIKDLPESIGKLKKLEVLDLTQNSLEKLPESIGELSELEKLYLRNNNLKTFPPSVAKLKKLKSLEIDSYKMGFEYMNINSVQDYFFGLIQKGDTPAVMQFIDNGIPMNAKTANGNTPLMEVSIKGATDLALALINKKAEANDGKIEDYIEEKNKNGDNALLLAAFFGQKDTAMVLIKSGANMEAKNSAGDTPLMLGVSKGHDLLVQALMDAGADIWTKNAKENTVLMIASLVGSLNLIKSICEMKKRMEPEGYQKYVDAKNTFGNNALLLAVDYGHGDVALELIKEGASVDVSNNNGDTTLIFASLNGNLGVVKALIEKKKKTVPEGLHEYLDRMNVHGYNALLLAVDRGHRDVALELIKEGASVDVSNKNQETTLMIASMVGNLDVVKAIFEQKKKMDPEGFKKYLDRINVHGLSALMFAISREHYDVALALIQAGANVNVKGEDDKTLLQEALNRQQEEIAIALIQAGADIDVVNNYSSPLISAVAKGYTGVVKALIEKKRKMGAQELKEYIDKQDVVSGRTALWRAVFWEKEDVAMALIDAGATVVNPEGYETILEMAQDRRLTKVVQALEGKMKKVS